MKLTYLSITNITFVGTDGEGCSSTTCLLDCEAQAFQLQGISNRCATSVYPEGIESDAKPREYVSDPFLLTQHTSTYLASYLPFSRLT